MTMCKIPILLLNHHFPQARSCPSQKRLMCTASQTVRLGKVWTDANTNCAILFQLWKRSTKLYSTVLMYLLDGMRCLMFEDSNIFGKLQCYKSFIFDTANCYVSYIGIQFREKNTFFRLLYLHRSSHAINLNHTNISYTCNAGFEVAFLFPTTAVFAVK